MNPQVSIVIPAHNEGTYLRATIDAILASTTVPMDITVVNDESTDGSCDFLQDAPYRGGVVQLIDQTRSGSSLSRNRGAKHARTENLVFLDAHCFPDFGWLEKLLSVLEMHRDSMVTPCISALQDKSLKGYGVTTDCTFAYTWLDGPRAPSPYEVPVACGACMMMRRELFDAVGGFDSTSIWGLEDIELSLRYWLMGHNILVVPCVEVAHLFKGESNFQVGWKDWVYNAFRCALLNFDGRRLSRILAELEKREEVPAAIEMLLCSDLWERMQYIRSRKRRDSDWLCERFSLAI